MHDDGRETRVRHFYDLAKANKYYKEQLLKQKNGGGFCSVSASLLIVETEYALAE